MIEIIFDNNNDDVFLHKKRSVLTLDNLNISQWSEYRALSHNIIYTHKGEDIIIIRNANRQLSVNWLAVALFIESCFLETKLDAVVFQTQHYKQDFEAYKPFLALTIGIKYVIRLYKENWNNIYNEISCLSYLGLNISEDYISNKLLIKLPGTASPENLSATTAEEALATIGIIKSLALSSHSVSIDAEILKSDIPDYLDIDAIIEKIITYVRPIIE